MDIFPVDIIKPATPDYEENKKLLIKRLSRYQKYYYSHRDKLTEAEIEKAKTDILNTTTDEQEAGLILHQPEFFFTCGLDNEPQIFKIDTIFPIDGMLPFEGYMFRAPHNVHEYLTGQFGDYMKFPRGRIEHHWLGESGDKHKALEHLKSIEETFKTQL